VAMIESFLTLFWCKSVKSVTLIKYTLSPWDETEASL